jgi:hypothetical protein
MKTEQKWMKLSGAIFVFIFVCGSRNEYKNIGNKYCLRPIILFANIDVSRHILVIDTSVLAKSNMDRREYEFRKQTWNKYGANTNKNRIIIGIKRPPESCSKT